MLKEDELPRRHGEVSVRAPNTKKFEFYTSFKRCFVLKIRLNGHRHMLVILAHSSLCTSFQLSNYYVVSIFLAIFLTNVSTVELNFLHFPFILTFLTISSIYSDNLSII